VAARVALKVARYIINRDFPKTTFLNINVPNLDEGEIKSYKITQQGRLIHNGDGVIEKMDPRGESTIWIGGGQLIFDKARKTDVEAVSKSYISHHSTQPRFDELFLNSRIKKVGRSKFTN